MKPIHLLSAACLLLCACFPSTQITGSWKNPNLANKPYTTVFVAAMTSNTIAKSTLEKDIATVLTKNGIAVIKSVDEFPPALFKDSITKEALIDKVRKNKNEAILTISLLKKTSESRYVRGSYAYAPMTRYGYYGSFGGYYTYWYPYAYSPGYYTEDDIYYLETNLYDSASELLIWSAQSETYSYGGLASFSKELANTIVGQLRKDHVLL